MIIAKKVYQFISSMKTGLMLLVVIGIVSAIASVVFPSDFFKSIAFKLLLLFLLLNMVLCTTNRLFLFKSAVSKMKSRQGLVRQSAILFLHAGIVVILVGGVIFSFLGQTKQISLASGETIELSNIMRLDKPISLTLNTFKVALNQDGSPSQYYSDVTVFAEGENQGKKVISVNHPLQYKNIKAYQESYGYLVKVRVVTDKAGEAKPFLVYEGKIIKVPGSGRYVKIFRYFSDYDTSAGMNQASMKKGNPRIVYSVYEKGKLLGVGAAKFGSKVEIDKGKFVIFDGVEPYSVLKVKADPGLTLVLIGSLLFMLGVTITLIPVRENRNQPQLQQEIKAG